MQRIQFKDYLRSNQLHREVSVAVRYAQDTPRKMQLMRDYFASAVDKIDSMSKPKLKSKSKEIK